MFIGVVQKKGDPRSLDGRVTVYGIVQIDQSDLLLLKSPLASMIHNGLLVAQGNFRDQYNLRDFLKTEMGVSLEEGLEEIIDKMGGLESALDPNKLRDKLENMEGLEDMIPTPAKIVPFRNEEDIMQQEGDIFCVGTFQNIANANLCVNALPMLYQARFREQEQLKLQSEIEQLVSQVETVGPGEISFRMRGINIEEKLLKEFIPNMLYCRKNGKVFEAAEKQFRTFMSGYQFPDDVDAIVTLIFKSPELAARHFKILELYAKKIAFVVVENFAEVEHIQRAIVELDLNSSR